MRDGCILVLLVLGLISSPILLFAHRQHVSATAMVSHFFYTRSMGEEACGVVIRPVKVRGEDYLHIEYEKNGRIHVHFDATLKNIEVVARSPLCPRSPSPLPSPSPSPSWSQARSVYTRTRSASLSPLAKAPLRSCSASPRASPTTKNGIPSMEIPCL